MGAYYNYLAAFGSENVSRKDKNKDSVKENWAAVLSVGAAIADKAIGDASPIEIGKIVDTAATLQEIFTSKGKKKEKMDKIRNPRFLANGYDGDSPRTRDYFKHRALKKIGGAVVSALGSIAASHTAVNVGGIARHGRAVANTAEHLYRLDAEAKRMKQSLYFQNLITQIVKAKSLKLVNRGGALAADCIPGCAIASTAISAITGIPTNIAMQQLDPMLTIAAAELHWRAFVERRIVRKGGTGPAMRIVHHLYVGIISEHHFAGVKEEEFIAEPCGWMVLKDKMTLI